MGEVSSFLGFSSDLLGDEGTSTLDGEASVCDGDEGEPPTLGFFLGDGGLLWTASRVALFSARCCCEDDAVVF